MTKHPIFILVMVVSSLSTVRADEPKPYHNLCQQLAASLQNNDFVEFSSCWISSRRFVQIKSQLEQLNPSEGLKAEEGVVAFAAELSGRRNLHIASAFDVLIKLLKEHGDLRDVKLVGYNIEGEIKEPLVGMKTIDFIYITVASGESLYKICIDDVLEFKGGWYFQDGPRFVETGPDNRKISLMKKIKE